MEFDLTDPNTLHVICALLMLSALKPTDKEFKRADKVLGPATKFVRPEASGRRILDCEPLLGNRVRLQLAKENSEIRYAGGKRYGWISLQNA